MLCRNCGDVVDAERVALGYDYCLKEECQQRCMKRIELASVAVNKAADYITSADEVAKPRAPAVPAAIAEAGAAAPTARPKPAPSRRIESALAQLRELDALLDAALDRIYDRFCRGEITAAAMDRARGRLIGAFNQRVMSENIRYRSMLRH